MRLPLALHAVLVLAWPGSIGEAAAPALAELPAPEIVSPLVATPIASPNPVLGADARRHLVYEIVLMDIGGSAIALDTIEVLDAGGDAVLATLEGEALAKILRLTGAGKGTALPAGGSGVLFMDVTWPRRQWSRAP